MTPATFIAVYAIAVVALVPASSLTILGGALYGVTRGTAYSLAGAIAGSTAAFLIARYGARGFVERRLASMPRVLAVERAVSARGLPIVFLLRLSPLVPFNVLNYALGVTSISLPHFLVGAVGMIPGALLYAYTGRLAGEALVLAGKTEVARGPSYYGLLIVGFLATFAAVFLVGGAARRALRDV